MDHAESDALRPCPRDSCAGRAPINAGRLHLLEATTRTSGAFVNGCIFTGWTSVVTFGPQFFAAGWGILLVVLAALISVLNFGVNNILRYPGNVASLNLSRRIVRRGMRLALSNFLTRYRLALQFPGNFDPKDLLGSEPFQQLHLAITGSWAQRYSLFVCMCWLFLCPTCSRFSFDSPALQPYLKNVFALILTRLQTSKTARYSQAFLNFVCLLVTMNKPGFGPSELIGVFDSLQPK